MSLLLADLAMRARLTFEVADILFLVPIGPFLLSVSPEWITIGFRDLYLVYSVFPMKVLPTCCSIAMMSVIEFDLQERKVQKKHHKQSSISFRITLQTNS